MLSNQLANVIGNLFLNFIDPHLDGESQFFLPGDVVILIDCAFVGEQRDGKVEESLGAVADGLVVGVLINWDANVTIGHDPNCFG